MDVIFVVILRQKTNQSIKIMKKVLIIGASGRIGSKVVKSLERNSESVDIVLATSREQTAEKWRSEGKESVVLDLNRPETFAPALQGIERLFLLTGYTSDMLFQAKQLIDAAREANVAHIVHLGTYTSRRDPIPHFTWHDLIESYINASGMAWTNIHPNVVTESVLDTRPSFLETGTFMSLCGNAPQGWACTDDIADVAATVLREGQEKHAGRDYYISTEVLTAEQVADILSEVSGRTVKPTYISEDAQRENFSQIADAGTRCYMNSAMITMRLTSEGRFQAQTALCDDVLTVTGRRSTTMREWAEKYAKLS